MMYLSISQFYQQMNITQLQETEHHLAMAAGHLAAVDNPGGGQCVAVETFLAMAVTHLNIIETVKKESKVNHDETRI